MVFLYLANFWLTNFNTLLYSPKSFLINRPKLRENSRFRFLNEDFSGSNQNLLRGYSLFPRVFEQNLNVLRVNLWNSRPLMSANSDRKYENLYLKNFLKFPHNHNLLYLRLNSPLLSNRQRFRELWNSSVSV